MFESYGIHTRLTYIIRRAGGIDVSKRKRYLKKTYNLDNDIVNRIWNYGIEKHIDTDVLDFIREVSYKQIEEEVDRKTLREFNNAIAMLCSKSTILSYY